MTKYSDIMIEALLNLVDDDFINQPSEIKHAMMVKAVNDLADKCANSKELKALIFDLQASSKDVTKAIKGICASLEHKLEKMENEGI